MKKVQLTVPNNITSVDKVHISLYYGVQINEFNRGFITARDYGGDFAIRSIDNLTIGNGWSGFGENKTFESFVRSLIESNYEVFEFDTFKKLSEWLTEE